MRIAVRTLLFLPTLFLPLLLVEGCGGDGGGTEPEVQTGRILVTVTSDGEPESGVPVQLFSGPGGTPLVTGSTGGNGQTTFSELDPGNYDIEVDPPSGLALSEGEMARKAVTVTSGATSDLSFALTANGGGTGGEVVEILLNQNLTFSPAQVTISPGTTVRWRNTTSMFHTVTPDGHSEWSSVSFTQADETFDHTFQNPGTFPYYCEPHRAFGMTGTIIVQ
jgi:plastocyanin